MVKVTFQSNPVTLAGEEVKVGDKAPDFHLLTNDLQTKTLADFNGKVKLFSVVPSVDTGVCALQTKRFNDEAKKLNDLEIVTVSVDLPFAQARFGKEEGITGLTILSDHRDTNFGKNYGVLMEDLRLLARAIFIIDKDDKVSYVEYVNEVTDHPNYDAALAHLKDM